MNWVKVHNNTFDFSFSNLNYISVDSASKDTINNILTNYPKPYHLMVSGGVDSQALLYLWHKFGKDFIPVSVVYIQNYNLYDICKLENLNQNYNFNVKYIDFDVINFLQTEYNDYAHKYNCSSPCICTHIKMSESLNGTIIYSGDFLHKAGPVLTNAILGLYRASLERKNIIPYFFLHTPELAYSLQKTVIMYDEKEDVYDEKVTRYLKNNIPVVRQNTKGTGFEQLKDFYDKHFFHQVPTVNRIKYHKKPSKRTFDLLYRYPYEDIFDKKPINLIYNTAESTITTTQV